MKNDAGQKEADLTGSQIKKMGESADAKGKKKKITVTQLRKALAANKDANVDTNLNAQENGGTIIVRNRDFYYSCKFCPSRHMPTEAFRDHLINFHQFPIRRSGKPENPTNKLTFNLDLSESSSLSGVIPQTVNKWMYQIISNVKKFYFK